MSSVPVGKDELSRSRVALLTLFDTQTYVRIDYCHCQATAIYTTITDYTGLLQDGIENGAKGKHGFGRILKRLILLFIIIHSMD